MSLPKYHMPEVFDPQRAHPDEAHSVLMRLIPQGSRVLELGCATGYLSGYMEKSLGCRVTGLEYDAPSAQIAATRCSEVHTVDLDASDALDLAKTNAPYDVLLAAAVLEHLKYPERLLQQSRSLLNADARIIVSLPNIAYWQYRIKLLLGQFDYTNYGVMDRTHLRLYTLKTGRDLLTSQGFQVESVYIAGSALQHGFNALARRLNRPLPKPILAGLLGYELIFLAKAFPTTKFVH